MLKLDFSFFEVRTAAAFLLPFLAVKHSTVVIPPPTSTRAPIAAAPMIMPMLEPEAAGAGVVGGDGPGGGTGGGPGGGAAVVAGCTAVVMGVGLGVVVLLGVVTVLVLLGVVTVLVLLGVVTVLVLLGVVVVLGIDVLSCVLCAADVLVGAMACTTNVGAETVAVLPTESVVSCVLTASTVMLCCTVLALVGLLSMRISVTTFAVPDAVSRRRSLEKPLVMTVLAVSTVALITAFGDVQSVS